MEYSERAKHRNDPIEIFFIKLGDPLMKLFLKIGITANQVSIFRTLLLFPAYYFFYLGEYPYLFYASVILFIWYLLDCVDGQMARAAGTANPFGAWMERISDRPFGTPFSFLGFFIILGIYRHTPSIWVWIVFFSVTLGCHLTHIFESIKYEIGSDDSWRETPRKIRRSFFGKILFICHMNFYLIIIIGAVFNQLLISMLILGVIYNIFWIGFAYYQYKTLKNKYCAPF